MDQSAQDRTLPATQRRLEKAREEGQVARSRDLGHLAVWGSGVALLAAFAPQLAHWLQRLLTRGLRFDANTLFAQGSMTERLAALSEPMFAVLLPIGAITAVLALAAGVLCGGWNFSWVPLQPKFEKLDPLAGLGRLFSAHQLTDTLKACLLAVVLGLVGGLFLNAQWLAHAQLLAMPLPAALAASGELLRTGLLLLAGVLAAFAIVDVPLQRQMHLRRLRMSLQDIKQEMKETDGDPYRKAAVRQRMREMAGKRMLAAVPKADLVVMNPRHYAVALSYDEQRGGAPRVVAKGADLLALRIRDVAHEHKVPVLQAPPLARALYAHCEVDQEIPARLFAAVAQVLAWVYQLRDAVASGRTMAADAPVPEVPADMDPLNDAVPDLAPAAQSAEATDTTAALNATRNAALNPNRLEPTL